MAHAFQRGVETIDRLREFSKQAPESGHGPVELNPLVHEAVELARPRIASAIRARGVRIMAEFGDPPAILARPSDLLAAVLKIISNAIDALIDGGTMTVSTGACDGGAWARIRDDGPAGDQGANLRAILHHEGEGWHGARARNGARVHAAPPRQAHTRDSARTWSDVHPLVSTDSWGAR
jgi:hypothetical protein